MTLVPDLPPTTVNLNGNLNVEIPAPPAGLYTPQEWATEISQNISTGLQTAVGVFTADVVATLTSTSPVTFSWDMTPPLTFDVIQFNPSDPIAPLLGVTAARDTVYGQAAQAYPGPLITFPETQFGTLHKFTIPSATYTVTELVAALNTVPAPYPNVLNPNWFFVDNKVVIAQGAVLPSSLRVVSVIDNRESTLAPLLGFQGTPALYDVRQEADTPRSYWLNLGLSAYSAGCNRKFGIN
jgi:hypothetical protein